MTRVATGRFTTEARAELLAVADPIELVALADSIVAELGEPALLAPPEIGLVVLQVREPVCAERFHLGEVVVTRAEVTLPPAGTRGWAMRLGTDRVATLAAAVCAAAAETDLVTDTDFATHVDDLCAVTARRRDVIEAEEWRELAATEVRFEELD